MSVSVICPRCGCATRGTRVNFCANCGALFVPGTPPPVGGGVPGPAPELSPTVRSISDDLFGRPTALKVFVSSRMRGGVLNGERNAAARAIEGTGLAQAWYWERDARAGPYSSEGVCLGHARTCDALVLILAQDLTRVTRAEYVAAKGEGAACFIMLKDGVARTKEVHKFIAGEQEHAITVEFRNVSELGTLIVEALRHNAVQATRRQNIRARIERRAAP